MSKLSGSQLGSFSNALRDGYNFASLNRLLKFRLERDLGDYAPPMADMQTQVFELISAANREGWAWTLLEQAHQSNPGNESIARLHCELGLGPVTGAEEADNLERTIRETVPYFNGPDFRKRWAEAEYRVCFVDAGDTGGTGFLVGPDLVMTNYHVVEPLLSDPPSGDPTAVVCQFDFKVIGGIAVSKGMEAGLAGDWLVDSSPYSRYDKKKPPKKDPGEEELDYALIRLKTPVGSDTIGVPGDPDGQQRGWFRIEAPDYDYAEGDPLFILQHPQGKPIKMAIDTDSIIRLNENGTRVTYRTNTEPGSSGSPCFNHQWELVALHHAGDPNFDLHHQPGYNQGIPIGKIRKLLDARGIPV